MSSLHFQGQSSCLLGWKSSWASQTFSRNNLQQLLASKTMWNETTSPWTLFYHYNLHQRAFWVCEMTRSSLASCLHSMSRHFKVWNALLLSQMSPQKPLAEAPKEKKIQCNVFASVVLRFDPFNQISEFLLSSHNQICKWNILFFALS